MLFDPEQKAVGALKVVEMDAIITDYVAAGTPLPKGIKKVEDFGRGKAERIEYILWCVEEHKAYPHQITEQDLEANEALKTEGVEVGEWIFLPFPVDEAKVREDAMNQVYELIAAKPREEVDAYMLEVAKLETHHIIDLVEKLRENVEAAPSNVLDPSETTPELTATGSETVGELQVPPELTTPRVAAPEATVQADTRVAHETVEVSDVSEAEIDAAIKTGKVVYENTQIIGFSAKIAHGKLHYNLYGANGATFLATKPEVDKLITPILA